MNIFESELKYGKFVIPECLSCKVVIWPPSNFCSNCLGKVKWRKSKGIGKILEYSKKDNVHFCLAEFENKIRIMGSLKIHSNLPKIGQKVKLESCRMDGKNYNFSMVLA